MGLASWQTDGRAGRKTSQSRGEKLQRGGSERVREETRMLTCIPRSSRNAA